jgi:uncharacterized membrane protein
MIDILALFGVLKMINIITLIVGLLFVVFIPGYLFSLILFEKLDLIERFALSFALSVIIVILVGFLLTLAGYILRIKSINYVSVWSSLIFICIVLIIIPFVRYRRKNKK